MGQDPNWEGPQDIDQYQERLDFLQMIREYVDEGEHDPSGVPHTLEGIVQDIKLWCTQILLDREIEKNAARNEAATEARFDEGQSH